VIERNGRKEERSRRKKGVKGRKEWKEESCRKKKGVEGGKE
jgi:hypothetical protein